MSPSTDATPDRLDAPTLLHAIQVVEQRLRAVETYGAGGCPTCHDAELRAAIARLRELHGGATR